MDAAILRRVVLDTDGCWLWQGAHNKDGYANVRLDGKVVTVHRVMYALLVGDPTGLELHHTCRNRGCVRPSHLEAFPSHGHHMRTHATDICGICGDVKVWRREQWVCVRCLRDADRRRNARNIAAYGVARPDRRK